MTDDLEQENVAGEELDVVIPGALDGVRIVRALGGTRMLLPGRLPSLSS